MNDEETKPMKKILDCIADAIKPAFTASGYDDSFAKITLSNRPDLCEYQCNGAMAAAKTYKKKPIAIAEYSCTSYPAIPAGRAHSPAGWRWMWSR